MPSLIREDLRQAFEKIYKKGVMYRASGCTISDLTDEDVKQQSLFSDNQAEEKVRKVYPLLEQKKIFFGSNLYDKKRIIEKKQKPKLSTPILTLESMSN